MSYLLEWLLPKNTRVIKCWWKCEEKGDLCTAGGNVNWFSHYGKQYDDSSKVKNRTSMWSSNSTSGYFLKENKNTNFKSYICIPMLIAALFAVAKTWKHKCLSNIIQPWKNEILPFLTTWMGLDAKWNVRQRQIPYNLSYMWTIIIVHYISISIYISPSSQITENRLVISRGKG